MNVNGWPRCVVFDFDYTLADSSEGIIESINYALSKIGLPEAKHDSIRRTIGLSLDEALVYLAGEELRERGEEFTGFVIEKADEVMADTIVFYDFVPDLTESLRAANVSLGIVSQKYRRRIEFVLERDGLDGRFDAIVGGEDMRLLKPDPHGLLTVIGRLGCLPSDALYVGDSVTDAETARRANVPFVAVMSGVTPRESFDGLPVLSVIRDASEIMGVLEKLGNSV